MENDIICDTIQIPAKVNSMPLMLSSSSSYFDKFTSCTTFIYCLHSSNCVISGKYDFCGNSKRGAENEAYVVLFYLLHYD